jgi:ubiquinol-cytochrome c reductase cytochrome c1 subunit
MLKTLLRIAVLALACAGAATQAEEAGYPLEQAPPRGNDMVSLQHGAELFVNHCLNCHSANFMRYNRLGDLGLSDDQIRNNLLFTGNKVGDLMTVAMRPEDAKRWFGTAPPDLSVMARAKSVNAGPSGADYLYTYLRAFYRDASRPTGWNNLAFPNVAMPHVLWERQGPRELTTVALRETTAGGHASWQRVTTTYDAQGFTTVKTEPVPEHHGPATAETRFKALDPARAAAYDRDMADLTAYLAWMAEPTQAERRRLGVWVLLFLGLFLVVAWRLNAAYWKHVR